MVYRRLGVWVLGCFWGGAHLAAQAGTAESSSRPTAAFERATVPAAGRQVTRLAVPEFGRYAIEVGSSTGTSIQIVDRMSGAGEIAGASGERDGRIDLFLDRGEVRVVTRGARLATGDARLSARRFVDRSAAEPERIVDGRSISTELADLEERSWWIEVAKRRRVTLEAAGRSLADLRIWQNGSWLVGATPDSTEIEAEPGRPLGLFRLSADLAPGLYRVAAYGGPARAWSREARAQPLHLRAGIPRDATALSEHRVVSPFGFDRFLVGGAADYFRLELAEAADASLDVGDFDPDSPFAEDVASSAFGKDANPPVATLSLQASDEDRVVTVRAAAGTAYVLQHFPRGEERRLARAGRYWISTLSEGSPGDALDGTAIVVELGDGAKRASRILAADVPRLAAGSAPSGWAGRFNLSERSTLQFEVVETGEYELRSHGIAVQARVEPFFVSAPAEYRQPASRPAPASWSLDRGYYVLELLAVEAGIADVELVPKGSARLAPVARGAARPGIVEVAANREALVRLNDRPDVASAIVARELPLDLVAALPLALAPGEEVSLPFRAPAASRLAARAENGRAFEVAVDDGAFGESLDVAAGNHAVRVRSTGDRTLNASVGLVPIDRDPEAPLPSVSPEALAARTLFAKLEPGSPRSLELPRGAAETFEVSATEPALYRIETTGLLATEAALRTRTQPVLAEAAENGTGRNARLAAYLRDGNYQLTVKPRGASAGALGVELERAPIDDGGRLEVGTSIGEGTQPLAPARATLEPGRAIAYRFTVDRAGAYRATARGLARDFRVRLEDAEGWPVDLAMAEGEQVSELEPGTYRLIVLPQAVAARAAVAVEPWAGSGDASRPAAGVPSSEAERIALDREVERVWREGPEGAPRLEDRFVFTLPADTEVEISLSPEMQGEIRQIGKKGAAVGKLLPGRPFRGAIGRGEFEIAVHAARRDEGRRYRLAVRPAAWVAGLRRAIVAPADVAIAVGEESNVELASFGGVDLKARLYDAADREIAAGDDRPGDWNFLIAKRLAPGRYRLRIETSGASGTGSEARDARGVASELEMRVPAERAAGALALPADREIELGSEEAVLLLELPAGTEIVAAGARAVENVALVLEERQGESWRALASGRGKSARLAWTLPRDPGELRMRISSLDRRPVSVRLTAFAGAVAHVSEADLARGFTMPLLPGVDPEIAAAVVDLAAPGCFRRFQTTPLHQALALGSAFEPAAPTLAAVGMSIPLAAAIDTSQSVSVRAERARVGSGEALALLLPAGVPVLCDVADGGAARVELVATGGEPVVGFVADSGAWGASTDLSAAGAARASAAAPAGRGRAVELWNAGAVAVKARLEGWLAREIAPASADAASAALATWPVPARAVVPLELPEGVKTVQLGVAGGGGALLLADGEPVAFLVGGETARLESFATRADRVLLFGDEASATALVAVAVEPASATATPGSLAADARFERRFAVSGRFRLPLDRSTRRETIEVRGASQAQLLGADGSVQRGTTLRSPTNGGELRIEHGAGFVTIWRHEGGAGSARTVVAPGATAQRLSIPAVVALSGSERAFEIAIDRPTMLSLRGSTPAAAAVAPRSGTTTADVYPAGVRLDAIVPAGTSRLELRGLAGSSLAGELLVSAAPLVGLREGLGEETLLAAGESRAYVFRVDRAGAIGVGVRSDRAGVEARLLDAEGGEIGHGAAIWHEAKAGGELRLVVSAPGEGPPARIRPALVGTLPPGDGPPREEIERFLRLAAGEPEPAARATVGVEDRPGPEEAPPDPDGEETFEDEGDEENVRSFDGTEGRS